MEVTIIPIVVGALCTITKGLVQRLEDLEITGRVETVQTTELLSSARILLKSWRREESGCHSNSSERPRANAGGKILRIRVVHVLSVHVVKFQFLSQFSVDHLAHPVCLVLYSSETICSIHLSCDWSFRLYSHITYICCFVASYLFLLWYDWYLWCYFELLLEEI